MQKPPALSTDNTPWRPLSSSSVCGEKADNMLGDHLSILPEVHFTLTSLALRSASVLLFFFLVLTVPRRGRGVLFADGIFGVFSSSFSIGFLSSNFSPWNGFICMGV